MLFLLLTGASPACRGDVFEAKRHLLFGDFTEVTKFSLPGSCRHVHHLWNKMLEFRHLQWTIICCSWQTESVFDEAVFSRLVSKVHATYLWKRDVRFVHDDKEFFRVTMELSSACCKEIQQAVGPFTRLPTIKMQRIILNGLTVPNLTKHFQIVLCTLLKAMPFDEFIL